MKVVGLQVKLKLIDEQYLEGKIYALSQSTNTLILEQRLSNASIKDLSSFHILKLEAIENMELGREDEEKIHLNVSNPNYIHVDRFASRLQQAGITFRKWLSKQGKNVSTEAQLIFDMISRTTPCRWEEPDIIVFDQIKIQPPYMTPESCSIIPTYNEVYKEIPSEDHETLQRVRRMLEVIKQRILSK